MAGVTDRTRDLVEAKKAFENDLRVYGTSGSDVAMLHYIDQDDDYDLALNNGLLDYAVKLKQEGTIRYIGFSSHSVGICNRFLDTGLIDIFMFSLNPAYDFENTSEGLRVAEERAALYAKAEKLGAAITVMKCYDGGKLLEELQASFGYIHATEAERHYDEILGSMAAVTAGSCIYCNHCLPCPVSINIGDVFKYYDLAQNGDGLAREHYDSLSRHASDCIHCGECEPRCPFHVKIMEGMDRMAKDMGR